jgi:hypothetical protein
MGFYNYIKVNYNQVAVVKEKIKLEFTLALLAYLLNSIITFKRLTRVYNFYNNRRCN